MDEITFHIQKKENICLWFKNSHEIQQVRKCYTIFQDEV